jgi:hypothetical protein
LQCEDVPGLVVIRVRDDRAGAVGEDVEVALVDAEVEDGDVMIYGGNHVNLKRIGE